MSRLKEIELEEAKGKTKKMLSEIKSKIGRVPNIYKLMANSPATLEAYLGFSAAMQKGTLSGKLREQIALAVSQENKCAYCLAVHTVIGKAAGLSEKEIENSRLAISEDVKIYAALQFAKRVVQAHGNMTDDDVAKLLWAGYTDGDVAEIVANVVLTIFTNYFNHVGDTEIDFPRARPLVGQEV